MFLSSVCPQIQRTAYRLRVLNPWIPKVISGCTSPTLPPAAPLNLEYNSALQHTTCSQVVCWRAEFYMALSKGCKTTLTSKPTGWPPPLLPALFLSVNKLHSYSQNISSVILAASLTSLPLLSSGELTLVTTDLQHLFNKSPNFLTVSEWLMTQFVILQK